MSIKEAERQLEAHRRRPGHRTGTDLDEALSVEGLLEREALQPSTATQSLQRWLEAKQAFQMVDARNQHYPGGADGEAACAGSGSQRPMAGGWRGLGDVAEVAFSSVDKKTVGTGVLVELCNYTDVFV